MFVPKKQFVMQPAPKPEPQPMPDKMVVEVNNRPSPQFFDIGDLEIKQSEERRILNFVAPTDITIRDAAIHIQAMRGLGVLNAIFATKDNDPFVFPVERGANELPQDLKLTRHERIQVYLKPESEDFVLEGVEITFVME